MKFRVCLISIFAGVILFCHLGIYLEFYLIQRTIRSEIKQKIKLGIPERETITLTFEEENYASVNWINEKEIKYKGKLFDIIRIIHQNHRISLQVISDEQEEKLFADLSQLTASELFHGKANKTVKIIFKLFDVNYLQSSSIILSSCIESNSFNLPKKINKHKEINISPPSPPPDFFI